MALALSIHLLAATYWVGGMWMMLLAVRPAAIAQLPPPLRIPLLTAVLSRFFIGVWVAVLALWLSGGWLLQAIGGMANQPWPIHLMITLALVMSLLFIFIYLVPFRQLRQRVAAQEWAQCGGRLELIRWIVLVNALLGALLLAAVSGGRYLLLG